MAKKDIHSGATLPKGQEDRQQKALSMQTQQSGRMRPNLSTRACEKIY